MEKGRFYVETPIDTDSRSGNDSQPHVFLLPLLPCISFVLLSAAKLEFTILPT